MKNELARMKTIDELAEILRIKKRHAYRLVKDKKIRALRFGKAIRILESDINDFISTMRRLEELK